MRLQGIKKGGEEAAVWLRDVCRGKSLVGRVVTRQADRLYLDLHEGSLEDVDVPTINREMIRLGLATKKDA